MPHDRNGSRISIALPFERRARHLAVILVQNSQGLPRFALALWMCLANACSVCSSAHPRTAAIEVTIDLTSVRAISPRIFGVNGTELVRRAPRGTFTLVRLGGNRYSAYNWRTNDSNAGADRDHQNDDYLARAVGSAAPVVDAIATGVPNLIVTVPMIGWVSADRNADGDVGASANYRETRFVRSQASCDSSASREPVICQTEFVQHVLSLQHNGVPEIDFELDNEPEGWSVVHPRLRGNPGVAAPPRLTYAELLQRSTEYARAIRSVNSDLRIFGPVGFGFPAFVDLAGAPDAAGRLFLDEYVRTMRVQRLLDVLDIHWYPMATVHDRPVAGGDADREHADVRVQLPRSLYDPTYVEPTWISRDYFHGPIQLLRWLKERGQGRLPLAITEYHYGGGNDISGAVAIADALGAFAFHGVESAAVWPLTNQSHAYTLAAFRVFRDGHSYAGNAVAARSSAIEKVSAWAAVENGRVQLVIVARTLESTPIEIRLPVHGRIEETFQIDAQHAEPTRANVRLINDGSNSVLRLEGSGRRVVRIVFRRAH